MPKKFDAATQQRAVRMVAEQQGEREPVSAACAAVSSRLRPPKDTLRGWVRRGQDEGTQGALPSAEREETKALRAKVRGLEEDNAALKAAATFFAGELDPRNR